MHLVHYQAGSMNSGGGRSGHQRGNNANNMMADSGMGSHHNGLMSGNSGYNMSGSTYGGGGSGMGGFNNGGGTIGGIMSNSGPMNRQDSSVQQYNRGSSGNYMNNHLIGPQHGNNSSTGNNGGWSNQQNRGHLDMPNLQALGINPQGANSSNQGQNMNNPLGVGLNLSSLPMNPAIVAAALNQWSLLGNQLQNQSQDQQGSNQSGNFLSWMAQANSGNTGGLNGSGGGKGTNNSNNAGSSGNQGINPSSCNESQQNGSVSSGGQGWSRQNTVGTSQGSTDKSKFL